MNLRCDDERLESIRLAYHKKHQLTDKEIMEDLSDEQDESEDLNSEDETKPDTEKTNEVAFDGEHFVPVKIEKFSIEEENKHGYFDPNGNYIPEDSSDEEESESEIGDLISVCEPDDESAINYMKCLLIHMNRKETVSQAFQRIIKDQDISDKEIILQDMTIAASYLQFMYEENNCFENIYEMTEKQIGKIYNTFIAQL